jgi:hypothetical protein
VPNLIADRGFWVACLLPCLNVRRLMYQTLIWFGVLRDDARGLGTPLYSQDLQRLADALVDRVRRNAELCGNLLGAEVVIDKAQAVELTARQPRDARGHIVIRRLA